MVLNPLECEEGWTLFLDRDGTINKRLIDDYVMAIDQFEFIPGVLKAMEFFGAYFDKIIVVTNQQGIGKELMTHEQLHQIHEHMCEQVNMAGARIDEIYYCPHLAYTDASCRKPNPGMAIQAQQQYKEIEFKRSIMVGDSESDITFGNLLGMYTVLIADPKKPELHFEADMVVSGLLELAHYIEHKLNTEV